MSKRTEGEWSFKKSDYGYGFAVFSGSTQITIGGCGCCSERDDSIDSEEDARLIAAAPELLEALIHCLPHVLRSDLPVGREYEAAKAAIAKATGETL